MCETKVIENNPVVTIRGREYEIFRREDGTPTMIEARDVNATNVSGYVAQIGLTFEKKALVDYDGVYEFPKAIIPWFIEQGFDMNYLDEGECNGCCKNPCECLPDDASADPEPFDCAGKPFEIGCRVENGLGASGIVTQIWKNEVSVRVEISGGPSVSGDHTVWDADAIEVVSYPAGSPNWGGLEPRNENVKCDECRGKGLSDCVHEYLANWDAGVKPEPIPTIRRIEALEDALGTLRMAKCELTYGSTAVWQKVEHAIHYLDRQITELLAPDPTILDLALEQAGKKRQTPVCSACGSNDVRVDAWAAWDDDAQGWDLSTTFEQNAICESEQCDGGECSIKWVDMVSEISSTEVAA